MPASGRLARLSRSIGSAIVLSVSLFSAPPANAADSVTVGGRVYTNKGLVAVGRLAADLRDKFGETFGSGSGLTADPKAWLHAADGYRGLLYMLPDRGYNVTGTVAYRARLNRLTFAFNPAADLSAMPVAARQHTLALTLSETMLLRDAKELPLTGLDPLVDGVGAAADGFPEMPQAPNGAVSLDAEAVVLMKDGSSSSATSTGPTSITSRPRAACCRLSGRPRRSSRSATARTAFRPTIQARASRKCAGQSADRPPEQSGLRRPVADAGRKISGRGVAKRNASGWRRQFATQRIPGC